MSHKIARSTLPVVLLVGSLGLGALVAAPAGATTKTAHTASATSTLSGTIAKTQPAKSTFWLTVGSKTYIVQYKHATFSAGTSASLVKGARVSVTGRLAGKKKLTVLATSLKA